MQHERTYWKVVKDVDPDKAKVSVDVSARRAKLSEESAPSTESRLSGSSRRPEGDRLGATKLCVKYGHHVAGYSAPCAGGSARTKGHHPVLVSSSPTKHVRGASGLVHDGEHSHGEG